MKFHIRIMDEADRDELHAECMSLPGCVVRGTDRDDVERKMAEAIRGYLAAVGNFVPERLEQEYVEEHELMV